MKKNIVNRETTKAMSKNICEMRKQLLKRVFSCYRGWWQWHCICRINGMQHTAVILIADGDYETAYFALLYLDSLLKARGFQNAIILSQDMVILKSSEFFSKNILATKKISRKQKDDLLQLMCLYRFDDRFICASLVEPIGRNGNRLIGKKNISKEEVFAVGVYGLNPLEKVQSPIYRGTDSEILAFMKGT